MDRPKSSSPAPPTSHTRDSFDPSTPWSWTLLPLPRPTVSSGPPSFLLVWRGPRPPHPSVGIRTNGERKVWKTKCHVSEQVCRKSRRERRRIGRVQDYHEVILQSTKSSRRVPRTRGQYPILSREDPGYSLSCPLKCLGPRWEVGTLSSSFYLWGEGVASLPLLRLG